MVIKSSFGGSSGGSGGGGSSGRVLPDSGAQCGREQRKLLSWTILFLKLKTENKCHNKEDT